MHTIKSEDKAIYNASFKAVEGKELEDEIISSALSILETRLRKPGELMASPESVRNFLRLNIQAREYETFSVVFLNNRHGLIEYKELFRGTIDGASVHPREVVKEALSLNAAAVILAHNHPSGMAEPSQADIRITQRLKDALALVDVRVLDHIIIGHDLVSLAERGIV